MSPSNKNLNTTSFRSGLTPFQLANHPSALKIIDPPTVLDIADWIYNNPKLGAFCGLKDLGFSVSQKNLMSVCAAFTCIYRFFKKHLTEQDKSLLYLLRGAYEKVCRTILQGCVRLRRDIRQLESEVSN